MRITQIKKILNGSPEPGVQLQFFAIKNRTIIIIIYFLSPVGRVFTVIYLKQTILLPYVMLQLCCGYNTYDTCEVISHDKHFVLLH